MTALTTFTYKIQSIHKYFFFYQWCNVWLSKAYPLISGQWQPYIEYQWGYWKADLLRVWFAFRTGMTCFKMDRDHSLGSNNINTDTHTSQVSTTDCQNLQIKPVDELIWLKLIWKGNFIDFTHQSLFTGVGEHFATAYIKKVVESVLWLKRELREVW